MIPPILSPFYNNPCLKDVQSFYAKESHIPSPGPITPPVILTPSPVLPPSLLFYPRYFFVPEELLPPKKQIHPPSSSSTTLSNSSRKQAYSIEPPSFSAYTPTPPQIFEIGKSSIKEHLRHHKKQIEDILYYLEELSYHHIEKIEERLVNGWIIIPRDFDKMPPKRTSTSEASAMTHAAIRKLVADSVATTLEAQTVMMTIINNRAEEDKVTYATGTLTDDALSWWNSYTQPIGIDQANQITWTELKRLLTDKYCPRTEVKKMEDEFYNLVVKGNEILNLH
ncbi:reverse transcriptase domain-containing protein [Tanacetum coccineum]